MASENDKLFAEEIQMMLFGLGDCATPLYSTAYLIGTIVKDQLSVLVKRSEEVAVFRGSSYIDLQDILFIYRKDKIKLLRVLDYIGDFELLSFQQNVRHSSLKDNVIRFLSSIGIDEENLYCIKDNVKMERLVRADHIAQSLDEKTCTEFYKSRNFIFGGNQVSQGNLIDWLKETTDDAVSKLKNDALDIISFFAKEIVADIVDYVLLVRQDVNGIPGDPSSRAGVCWIHEDLLDPLSKNYPLGDLKSSLIEGSKPITPEEVREVLRRHLPILISPFGICSRISIVEPQFRLL